MNFFMIHQPICFLLFVFELSGDPRVCLFRHGKHFYKNHIYLSFSYEFNYIELKNTRREGERVLKWRVLTGFLDWLSLIWWSFLCSLVMLEWRFLLSLPWTKGWAHMFSSFIVMPLLLLSLLLLPLSLTGFGTIYSLPL